MVDYGLARKAMVDSQVNSASVTQPALLSAMGSLPRENFVPLSRQALAYIDDHHPLGAGRFMPSPAIFARLAQLAGILPSDTVLELGAGTGYGTAVLAALAQDVVGLEADQGLAEAAQNNLALLDIKNARVLHGEPEILGNQQFDVILAEGTLMGEPADLLARLKPGGRLVALIPRGAMSVATRFVAERGAFRKDTHFDATLPPLYPASPADAFVF